MVETPEWMLDAPCRRKHGDAFYPPLETDTPSTYYDIGRTVCASCPVWRNCLQMGKKEIWGMWGGLTPQERAHFMNEEITKHLVPHGTFRRFRQGCRCKECACAHKENSEKEYETQIIPTIGAEFPLLNELHERLFTSVSPVD